MAIPLKIRALCVELGYCEGQRASCFFVQWTGRKPFEDAHVALVSFIDQCRMQCIEPERELAPCCKHTLSHNPKAKGCEECGELGRRKSRREYDMADYIRNLADMDVDSFGDNAYPCWEYPGTGDGSCKIGDWEFFQGFPTDCDIVVVSYLDKCFDDAGAMDAEYHVVHGGKAATRKSVRVAPAPHPQHLPPNPPDLERAAKFVECFEADDDHQIRVWAFDRAPVELQMLSTNGGDEDYVFYIPPAAARDDLSLYWIDNLDGGQRPQVVELPRGAQVRIVSHT